MQGSAAATAPGWQEMAVTQLIRFDQGKDAFVPRPHAPLTCIELTLAFIPLTPAV
jgi:hypothetical protein